MKRFLLFVSFEFGIFIFAEAQPIIETGGNIMPVEWIDKSTGHRVIKLSRIPGSSFSFYFNNNPFIGNEMIFYNGDALKNESANSLKTRREANYLNGRNKQLFSVNLKNFRIKKLTNLNSVMDCEIVNPNNAKIYFQIQDSIYELNSVTNKQRLVSVLPKSIKGQIFTINANGKILAGSDGYFVANDIYNKSKNKKDYSTTVYNEKKINTIFTINISTGKCEKVFSDSSWLTHLQFSPIDPSLLLFCHEGPWDLVDRIWTLNLRTKETKLIHKRMMEKEVVGHEWFGSNGNFIWYDLQRPVGSNFFIGGTNIKTGKELKYSITRNESSVHFNSSSKETMFAGDGCDSSFVAQSKDAKWIYLFYPSGDSLKSQKLVNMKYHQYYLEPNVHFSPDDKWIIFRSNFEGVEGIYAVEIKQSITFLDNNF